MSLLLTSPSAVSFLVAPSSRKDSDFCSHVDHRRGVHSFRFESHRPVHPVDVWLADIDDFVAGIHVVAVLLQDGESIVQSRLQLRLHRLLRFSFGTIPLGKEVM